MRSSFFVPRAPASRRRHPFVPVSAVCAFVCVFFAALFLGGFLGACAAPETGDDERDAEPPNVVLISIDTLRADHLGAYGYDRRPTSPRLDALAEESAVFLDATSQAPWTTPAHMSLFTSLLPSTHGLLRDWDVALDFMLGRGSYPALPPSVPTLAELLHRAGYATLARVGGGTISADFGFGRGFDVYEEASEALSFEARDGTIGELRRLLEEHLERPGKAPFFLFFHTFEVHAPYRDLRFASEILEPHEVRALAEHQEREWEKPIQAERDLLRQRGLFRPEVVAALYDGGIRSVDERLGRLFDALRQLGVWEETVVIVTSDHGEELGERHHRNLGDHGQSLYQEMLHVPLIVHAPRLEIATRRIDTPVALLDVAPTILDLAGAEIPEIFEGRSLVPLMEGRTWHDQRAICAEAVVTRPEQKMLRRGELKLVGSFGLPGERRTLLPEDPDRGLQALRLFDLATDGEEHRDLRAAGEAQERDLPLGEMTSDMLDRFAEAAADQVDGGESEVEVTDETKQKLRALGYIE